MIKTIFAITALAAFSGLLPGQQLANKKGVTLEIAKKIAAAAEAEAVKNKFTMFITVMDDTGIPIYIEKMDETQLASYEISVGKARTALFFKRPTKALEDAVAGGRNAVLSLPATVVEGGMPLTADGKIIGSVGCSGGTSPQDAQVCQAAVTAFDAIVKGGK